MNQMKNNTSVIVPGKKLGKCPPKFDKRTLRLANYIQKRQLPKVPSAHILSKKTRAAFPDLGMMRNDVLGDCTCAAIGHMFETWTAYGGEPWRPTDKEIVALYDLVNGGVDEGANMLDVLNQLRTVGIGGRKIHAFVAIDPTNHDQVRTAHYLFGGIYFGANLPVNAQDQTIWDFVPENGSDPGSWGGHAMNIEDFGKAGLTAITWGDLQKLTWKWWDRYVDEAYCILDENYLGNDKKSPQGFSLSKLAADLKSL